MTPGSAPRSPRDPRPPRLSERLLESTANRGDSAAIAGDIAEEFHRRAAAHGPRRARLWYRLFVLRSLPSFVRHTVAWSLTMFKNYLTIALRVMRRHKAFTFINLAGLAVGMACSVMIGLYVVHESGYDRFHANAPRIFRVYADINDDDGDFVGAWTPPPLAKALLQDFPEVEEAARYSAWPREFLITAREKSFLEGGIKFADASFFRMFSYPFIFGDAATALEEPGTIVLSRRVAEKYFGHDDPVGQAMTIKDIGRDYRVTGVIEDPPPTSHFRFDAVASIVSTRQSAETSWTGNSYFTYVLLREGASAAALEAKLPDFARRRYGPQFFEDTGVRYEDYYAKDGRHFGFRLEPLTDIHLGARVNDNLSLKGNASHLRLLSAVAFFILLIAAINFMNLATARFAHRSREVGVRKVLGSERRQLVVQFLGESLLLSVLALVIAVGAMALVLPAFGRLAGRPLAFGDIFSGGFPLLLAGVALAVGLAAGSYPALFLSSFAPQATIKGRFAARGKGHARLRRGLVLVQFAVGFAVLFGTGVIAMQMRFLASRDLGFDKERVVVINRANALGPSADAFETELLSHPGILKISRTESLPGRHFDDNGHVLEGALSTDERPLLTTYVDDRFADLLGLKLAAGRFFRRDVGTDATSAVVINRTAARELGLAEPVGKRFHKQYGGAKEGEFVTIIGVLEDFHIASLHTDVRPMILRPLSPAEWRLTSVKVRGEGLPATLALIERTWKQHTGGQPFQYSFLDQDFGALYDIERRAGKIFSAFSALAVLVACLGLYGLVSFSAEQRTREIGIRKALGASMSGLAGLLSREVIALVGIAVVVASPPAFFLARQWLRDFAYRAPIRPWMFVATAAAVLAVAFLSVAYRALRAAAANPVETLRNE
jgi:putative ABC transport system permease protein